jgi:hypothetical protein
MPCSAPGLVQWKIKNRKKETPQNQEETGESAVDAGRDPVKP